MTINVSIVQDTINVNLAGVGPQGPSGDSIFIDFLIWSGLTVIPNSDITTLMQNFLLYCQLQALQLKPDPLDNINMNASVTAYIPRGYCRISCPLIIPEYVNLLCDATIIRTGSLGTATAFYTGDTTTKALANLCQPAVIMVPRALCDKIGVICDSNGSDNGTGLAAGKTWFAQSVTLLTAGSGFQVGDIINAAQPSIGYYMPISITVNSVNGSGAILTYTLTNQGAYGLPPVLQKQQWTTANGFTVFDANGNFLWTGGHGTGATFSITWSPDFLGNGSGYIKSSPDFVVEDLILRNVNITQAGVFTDSTYGQSSAFDGSHLFNARLDQIQLQGGENGAVFQFATDIRILSLNCVEAANPINMESTASWTCLECILDTPSGSVILDSNTLIISEGNLFNRNRFNFSSPATFLLGQFTSNGVYNRSIRLKYLLHNAGAGGDASHISSIGCPAISIDYTDAYDIDFTISNKQDNYVGTFAIINKFANFTGTHLGAGRLRGSIEVTFGSIFSGTIPAGADIDIWDADVSIVNGSITATIGGTATVSDTISIIMNNPNLSYSYHYPRTASFTVTSGALTTTQIAAGLVAAINAETVLSITGVVASNVGPVITIVQMGADANLSTFTATVSGSATETVTFSNSGEMSGSIAGGKVSQGGLYNLVGSGAPTSGLHGTGWGKAPKGSSYTDYLNAVKYTNNSSSINSPNWV